MSFVIKSENHGFKVVTVNVSLHNRVSGGLKFSLNEIPMALNISLELVCIVLCVFHDRQRSVGILVYSQTFEQSDFICLMQFFNKILFEF